MQSQVNLARIVRCAALFGVTDLLVCGRGRMDLEVSLGAEDHVRIQNVRTLAHPLRRLRHEGFCVIGLEQTERSQCIFSYAFPRKSVLLIGHERRGVPAKQLSACDAVVEIPTFGSHLGSHNASTAMMMAMFEYCRQHRHD